MYAYQHRMQIAADLTVRERNPRDQPPDHLRNSWCWWAWRTAGAATSQMFTISLAKFINGRRLRPMCTRDGCSRWTSCICRACRRHSVPSWCWSFSLCLAGSRAIWPCRASSWLSRPSLRSWRHVPAGDVRTPKSKRWNFGSIVEPFKQCFPVHRAVPVCVHRQHAPRSSVMEGVSAELRQPAVLQRAVLPRAGHSADRRVHLQSPCSCAWRTSGPTRSDETQAV